MKPILGVKAIPKVFAYAESAQRPYLLHKTMHCSPTLGIGRENEPTGRASAPTLPNTSSMVVALSPPKASIQIFIRSARLHRIGLSTLQLVQLAGAQTHLASGRTTSSGDPGSSTGQRRGTWQRCRVRWIVSRSSWMLILRPRVGREPSTRSPDL